MSSEQKQQYLKKNIIDAGLQADEFISFLESKNPEGSSIDIWTLEELESLVDEFKNILTEGETIQRRATTKDEALALFGQASDSEEDEKKKESSDSSSNDSDEYKDKKNKSSPKQPKEKKDDSSSSESEDEVKPAPQLPGKVSQVAQVPVKEVGLLDDQDDDFDFQDDDEGVAGSSQKFYNKKECHTYPKTDLVGGPAFTVTVSNPEEIKGKGLKQGYTVYTIKVLPNYWEVKRRYSDFEWLHMCLQKRFPANYVIFKFY